MLPQWIVGPTALGNPLAWVVPVGCILMPGTSVWIRVLVMGLGLVSVLLAIYRKLTGAAVPPYKFTASAIMWSAALMLLSILPRVVAPAPPAAVAPAPPVAVAPAPPVAVAPADLAPDLRFRVYHLSEVEVRPELQNPEAVARVVSAGYPVLLRDAGVTGTVTVAFSVDPNGVPDPASMTVESATHDAFIPAALEAVRAMRFLSAWKDGHAVWVRVKLPVTFTLPRAQ
jgi:TonB family protein